MAEQPSDFEELDLSNFEQDPRPFDLGPGKRVEQTRAVLAYLMFGLLSAVFLALFILLACKRLDVDGFTQVAGVVISPVVGLLGAATGYYYGRGDR